MDGYRILKCLRYYPSTFHSSSNQLSEGWPKILSEAMMFGVVPLASDISSIPQIFSSTGTGIAISPIDVNIYKEIFTLL